VEDDFVHCVDDWFRGDGTISEVLHCQIVIVEVGVVERCAGLTCQSHAVEYFCTGMVQF
jgi:hypothetical protein